MADKKPKVTVLMGTYNRPDYLREAIASVVAQVMDNWELLVMNDGGVDVRHIVQEFADERVRYFHDDINRGFAFRVNFGLKEARGEYVAYLGDDDLYYPDHLEILSRALDENSDIGAVYSDLFAVQCIIDRHSGKRYPLHKFIQVSRDFNRDFMFYFNHTLHVSLMHRRDLAIRAGGYQDDITVLIDWNMTRKLCFYTDFKYIPVPTGEYYMPVGKSDRISVREREDNEKYKHNLRKIKADLPPEPWSKVERIGIIFPVNEWNDSVVELITDLIDSICYPARYIIINNDAKRDESFCGEFLGKIGELKNVSVLTPPRCLSELEAYRFGVKAVDVDYVYLPTKKVAAKLKLRLMSARRYLKSINQEGLKWDVKEESEGPFDILLKKNRFLALSNSAKENQGLSVVIVPQGVPKTFESDFLLYEATLQYENGNYRFAYAILKEAENIKKGGAGKNYIINLYSKICFELGLFQEAEEKLRVLIDKGYGAENLVRLGFILQKGGRVNEAIDCYAKALKEIDINEEDLESECFPIAASGYLSAFEAFVGLGEGMLEKNDLTGAARMFRMAAKLKTNSARPLVGFGKLFLKTNSIEKAEDSLKRALMRDEKNPEVYCLLGEVFERQQRINSAYKYYLKAFQLDKANTGVVGPAFRSGSALGKWGEIKDLFKEYLEYHPGDVQAMMQLSTIYHHLGEFNKAREYIERSSVLTG
jgi:glycosyltransferase involved in cell wall biosynthesis/tetratricopeptide (TPR) repeat protein